jgi:outer membrane protein OmpA-like peptidoglycan-associated protein
MAGIMELVGPLLQGGILDKIAGFIGAPAGNARQALETAVPASITGLAQQGSTEHGASQLLTQLRSGEAPELGLGDVGATLADPQATEQLMDRNQGFMERILGGRASTLTDLLSSHSGIGRGAASKIFGIAMPLVLGIVGKHARSNHLDAQGLSRYLGEQSDSVTHLLPAQFQNLLGGKRDELPSDRFRGRALHGETDWRGPMRRRPGATPDVNRYLPWALAGLAAVFAISYVWNHRGAARRPIAHVTTPANPPQEQQPPAEEQNEPAQAQPSEIEKVAGGSPAAQMSRYLGAGQSEPKRFVAEGMTFESGSAQLTPDGKLVAGEIASVLSDHPQAKVRIEGFTDATGSAQTNAELSQSRAEATKTFLSQHGVSPDHITVAGFGAAEPVAPNDNPADREKNRRIELVVSPH